MTCHVNIAKSISRIELEYYVGFRDAMRHKLFQRVALPLFLLFSMEFLQGIDDHVVALGKGAGLPADQVCEFVPIEDGISL